MQETLDSLLGLLRTAIIHKKTAAGCDGQVPWGARGGRGSLLGVDVFQHAGEPMKLDDADALIAILVEHSKMQMNRTTCRGFVAG